MSAPLHRWEWCDGTETKPRWIAYDETVCHLLDRAIDAGVPSVRPTKGYYELNPFYQINVQTMMQKNLQTGYQRKIRRVPVPSPAATIATLPPDSPLRQCEPPVIASYMRSSGSDPAAADARFQRHSAEMKAIIAKWDALHEECVVPHHVLDVASASEIHKDATSKVLHREKRLMMEFRTLMMTDVLKVQPSLAFGTMLDRWVIKLHKSSFSPDVPLAQDFDQLPTNYPGNIDHIRMEVLFPPLYPVNPPFFRIVYPRFKWHTGHVSWGGSICLETLVNTGTSSGYQSTYSTEALLQMVLQNLVVDNAPAGVSAGRIDFERAREFDRLDYSIEEGISNFRRIVGQHGWDQQEEGYYQAKRSKGEAVHTWSQTEAALIDIASRSK